jgi:CheY-like chemotaxis protein
MDMTYRILWIDDNVSDLDGSKKLLETRLAQRSLSLRIDFDDSIKQTDDINKLNSRLRSDNPYDLIMVDYDLGSDVGGVSVLKRLRNIIHGHLVLYSSTPLPELRKQVYENTLDGVFCLTRTSLRTQLFPIIESSLEKFKMPVVVRGLVVGAVGEIDDYINQIGASIIGNLGDAERDEILNAAKDNEAIYLNQLLDDMENKYSIPISKLIKKMNLHQKKILLEPLFTKIGCQSSLSCLDSIHDYMSDINPFRIDLAHSKTIMVSGVPRLSKKDGGSYTSKEISVLMTRLSQIKSNLEDAKDHFCSAKTD